jgi:MoxR-like ATPase
MLVGILSDGHILLEGVPGHAPKPLAVNSLATAVQAILKEYSLLRILLPSDLTGTLIYDSKQCDFSVKKDRYFLILYCR